jgi:DNA ligase-1
MKIYDVLTTIQKTASTKSKKQILKDNMCDTIAAIFEDTYGPVNYYIKQFEKPEFTGTLTLDNDYQHFRDTLINLINRYVTGQAAYDFLQSTVADFDAESQDILCRVIDRNLKIGISWDNYLDVIGQKDTKFEVALAENISKVKGVDPIDGTYFISRKLDGVRCVCFVHNELKTLENGETIMNSEVQFTSRQNKNFTTLDNLIYEVQKFCEALGEGSFVLDGEVCLVDDNDTEDFSGIMKEITRKNHTIKNPRYKVFDILTLDEFWGRVESPNFKERYEKLLLLKMNLLADSLCGNVDHNSRIDIVKQHFVDSQEVLNYHIDLAKEHGWEGCMLRKNAPYKRGRTKDLLKIKSMQDAEYEVIGLETGTATYNNDGSKVYDVVSAIKILHKDNVVSVGSGLSKEQRLRWLEHHEEIIGKTVTIQYFEETVDSKTGKSSLRFPVLKHVYEDGRNI